MKILMVVFYENINKYKKHWMKIQTKPIGEMKISQNSEIMRKTLRKWLKKNSIHIEIVIYLYMYVCMYVWLVLPKAITPLGKIRKIKSLEDLCDETHE